MTNFSGNALSDKQLVEKILKGNTEAFGLVIKNTERLVTQMIFKMISNSEDRKDLAQEVYLKAYKKLSGFKFDAKLSTWVAQICYHTCLDYLRKKKIVLSSNLYEDEASQTGLVHFFNMPSDGGTTNDSILQKDLSILLKIEIDKLAPIHRTLITLYHNEELSYEEIGQITGLPAGTVKSYLFRARKALKNNLLLNYKKEDL